MQFEFLKNAYIYNSSMVFLVGEDFNQKSIQEDKSSSAVSIGLTIDVNPGSSSVVVVEVSPEIPPAILNLAPVPGDPGGDGALIHKWHVETIVELGPSCVAAKVSLAESVSGLIINKVVAAHGDCHLDDSSGPAVVIASIDHGEGSELDGDVVERTLEGPVRGDADEGELFVAGLVSLEGVAVVAGEPAGPVGVVAGPDGGLEGESLLDGFETELIDVRDSSIVGADRGCQQQHDECQPDGLHQFIYQLLQQVKNYCGLIFPPTLSEKLQDPSSSMPCTSPPGKVFLKNGFDQNNHALNSRQKKKPSN